MAKRATENKDMSIEAVAARAIALAAEIKAATDELEGLKEQLRESAMINPWRELPTPLGSVRAAFVDPYMGPVKTKKGSVSLLPLLDSLAPDHFALLFEKEVLVSLAVKEITAVEERLALLTPNEQDAVRALIEEKPSQIRITLPVQR